MKLVVLVGVLGLVSLAGARDASAQVSRLTTEQWLMPGQALTNGCYYRATMQTDGNLVLTKNAATRTPYWASGTAGSGAYGRMQSDGNFVIYNWADSPVWATGTQGNPGARLDTQTDGNLVVYSSTNSPRWSSGTAGAILGSTNCYSSNFALTQVYFGWDARGGDYSSIILDQPRASWCAYFCSQDSRCKLFTYVPPGIQNARAVCWLKDSTVTWAADSRMVSGAIVR
jgi:hypothetical protein